LFVKKATIVSELIVAFSIYYVVNGLGPSPLGSLLKHQLPYQLLSPKAASLKRLRSGTPNE